MDNTKGIGRPKDTPSVKTGKNYFLGIGINDYSSGWSALHNAVRDVERIGQILQDKYDFHTIAILTNDKATRFGILRQLRALQTLSEDDSLLIYYSGHGHLAKEDGYWIPVNADTEDIDNYIPNAQLHGLIKAIPTWHTLLIADACFSGSFFSESDYKTKDHSAADDFEKKRSRWAFCSGRHDQKVSDGPIGTHSPFAEALIRELEGNSRPKVYIQELAIPVINRTAGKYRQTPKANLIFDCGDDGGQFVFSLKDNEAAITDEDISDIFAFQSIDTIGDIRDFMRNYPNSSKIPDAIAILKYISQSTSTKTDNPKIETPSIIIPKKFDFEPEMVFVEGGSYNREYTFKEIRNGWFHKLFSIEVERKGTQRVTLSDFFIGKYPITQEQWQRVMGNNPSHFKGNEKCPVENVSWDDCQEFIKKLNEKTHKKYRLPTEAEWVFAAIGGNHSKNYEFNNSINKGGKLSILFQIDETHAVDSREANILGIHDLVDGNVYEWCNDFFESYEPLASVTNPKGPKRGSPRVVRGGIEGYRPNSNLSFERCRHMPSFPNNALGFRLALSL